MKLVKKSCTILLLFVMLCTLVIACGNTNEHDAINKEVSSVEENPVPNQETNVTEASKDLPPVEGTPTDPVTVTVAFPWGEEIFNNRFQEIDEKLPNVNIEMVACECKSASLQELFASGVNPDIIFPNHGISEIEHLDVIYPLDELAKSPDFDIHSLNPSLVSYIRSLDSEGRLIGIPDGTGYLSLFYNKEIFDLFGVPYPTETMTWDQAFDLAKKMTGQRNGVSYLGLELGGYGNTGDGAAVPLNELAVNKTDPDTGEVLITKDPAFTKYLELMKKYYSIPGVRSEEAKNADLFGQKQAAMTVTWTAYFVHGNPFEDVEYLKDKIAMLSVPVWADQPTIGPVLGTTPMVISSSSEHKDAAFSVLKEYVSVPNQTKIAQSMASGPVLTEVSDQYGSGIDNYAGQDVTSVFKLTPATHSGRQSLWDQFVKLDLAKFADSDMNVQEFLRITKDEGEAAVAEARTQLENTK
ncbi:extracellular solute-binding protein [Paenibacillus sp. ISL-20]|uniref:ABC transporter substrate-binding protein n=1 Tax=Paenibacillus sp. ISL-20 TaxID=2819163 RepID=UPI001BEB4D22|nr:extracellular solute-binding protein [Paenibacillus sp. ISL-20]MBT2763353.1 extracellular solute-binding protein [Paenibacillus sp. ISL-20]